MNGTSRLFLFRLAITLVAIIFCAPLTRADSTDAPKHKPNTKLWKSEKEQGEAAFKSRQMTEAEAHFQAALAEAENFDAKDYRLAESLTELGEFYARTGKFADAEPLLQRAVDIRRGDPKPLIEAQVQFLYGFTCLQLHHNDAAEKAFLRAQELYSRKLGPDHPLAVRCSFYLGAIYGDEKNYAKAEPLFKRCLTLFEHPSTRLVNHNTADPAASSGTEVWIGRFRPDFGYALETMVRLGMLYAQENRIADSDASFKDALKMIDERLAKNDPTASSALGEITEFYVLGTNYAGAEPFIQRYIAFSEKTRGTDDPATLAARMDLARIYEREGKFSEAENTYKQAIAAREIKSGSDGAATSATEPLIQLYFRQGRYQDAESLVARQLAGIEKNQGEGLAMMPVLDEQATIYTKLNRDADLESVYKKEIAVYEKMFGSNSRALVKPLTNYAALLRKSHRDPDAEAIETRVKSIQGAGK